RLLQIGATDGESFYSVLAGPMAILNTSGDTYFEVRPHNRAKDQALPGGLLETSLGFEYIGIFFKCSAKDLP
ncbi:MAG TPA: hypothetical protein VIW07_13550, partial [Candidatus Udaeobacter sp.]